MYAIAFALPIVIAALGGLFNAERQRPPIDIERDKRIATEFVVGHWGEKADEFCERYGGGPESASELSEFVMATTENDGKRFTNVCCEDGWGQPLNVCCDGWGHPLLIEVNRHSNDVVEVLILSAGRNNIYESGDIKLWKNYGRRVRKR
jgi:hypothetical protein